MSIRFRCKRCHQLLGISERRAGSQIQCPKCGLSLTVPTKAAADASLAMDKMSGPVAEEDPANFVVYDDEPEAIETPRARHAARATATKDPPPVTRTAPAQAAAKQEAAAQPAAPEGRPVPRGMILFHRRNFYAQGFLFLLLAAAAFASGYYIGRGDATYEKKLEVEAAAKESILLEGRIVYNPGTGQIAGDRGAVIVALPQGTLDPKLDIRDIRVTDPPPTENHKTLRRIRELGGGYARANVDGNFTILLPDQGKYCLLIISANATRPPDQEPGELDLVQIENYFTLPDHLIDRYKYRWETMDINVGTDLIQQDFGHDAKQQAEPEERPEAEKE